MTTPSTASHMNASAITPEFTARLVLTGAGAAVPTKVRGKGFTAAAITRQGVGLYTLFLVDGGAQVVGLDGKTDTAATVSPQIWKFVPGSYVRSTATGPAQLQAECWNMVTPALADPPAGSLVELQVSFAENVVD